MLIDVIVGSAVLLTALYCWYWWKDPALRARIERPKYVFLAQALDHDSPASTAQPANGNPAPASPRPAASERSTP